MRNWNVFQVSWLFLQIYVFRVPMRNWNRNWDEVSKRKNQTVFRVPMRNWNRKYYIEVKKKWEFLECLWGIEIFLPDFSVWLGYHVFRVPMRNWNNFSNLITITPYIVFRVPMRNWNLYIGIFLEIEFRQVFRVPMRNWNEYANLVFETKSRF